jgi:hypothetical protein
MTIVPSSLSSPDYPTTAARTLSAEARTSVSVELIAGSEH